MPPPSLYRYRLHSLQSEQFVLLPNAKHPLDLQDAPPQHPKLMDLTIAEPTPLNTQSHIMFPFDRFLVRLLDLISDVHTQEENVLPKQVPNLFVGRLDFLPNSHGSYQVLEISTHLHQSWE